MNVIETKCLITMLKKSKSELKKNGPLKEYGPHWINFTILTFMNEIIDILEAYIKLGTKLFHLT